MSAVETLLQIWPDLADNARHGPGHVMVCCPFHKEKTPSMAVSTDKPVYFCHGCHVSGHISQLLRMAGCSRSMIDVLLPRGERIKEEKEKKNIAARLMKGEDPFTGEYILDEEMLDAYRLAPTNLLRAGYHIDTLRHFEVGYDSKNLRITFPLRNVFGDLVGISGRTILDADDGTARYRIYDRELKERTDYTVPKSYTMEKVKSALLWHGHIARPMFFARDYPGDTLIIVEGFKACMWTWQAGYQDVVALVGSYLTDLHAELIARAVKKVVLFLDNNTAGHKGTRQGAKTLMRKGVEVLVAAYPDQREQPDNLAPEEIDEAVSYPLSIMDWRTQNVVHEDASAAPSPRL
jgi:DNA primase